MLKLLPWDATDPWLESLCSQLWCLKDLHLQESTPKFHDHPIPDWGRLLGQEPATHLPSIGVLAAILHQPPPRVLVVGEF